MRTDELARVGLVVQETARIFSHSVEVTFRRYRHQEEAIQKAFADESVVVTSGRGSSKRLCYFLQIVNT